MLIMANNNKTDNHNGIKQGYMGRMDNVNCGK